MSGGDRRSRQHSLRSRHRRARSSRQLARSSALPALRQRPEFVATALLRWLFDEGIESAPIAPGKPWQNGTDEGFNGRFRDECLNLEWFRNRIEVVVVIERWRCEYNEVRPHSSLGDLTPFEFKSEYQSPSTPTLCARHYHGFMSRKDQSEASALRP
jgi:putative transposase